MRKYTIKAAATLIAVALSSPALAQQQQQQDQPVQPKGQAAGNLAEAYQREKAEADKQGSKKVEVREKALWGLSELPRQHMFEAMKHIVEKPVEAKRDLMIVADVMELHASLGRDRDGNPQPSQRLMQQAEQIRELAKHVEFKLVLNKDDFKQPFAQASLALADFYQQAAAAGVQRKDEEQTGYTLKGAAEYLQAAHAFGEARPTPQVSEAILNADRLSAQIIKSSKETTIQKQSTAGAKPQGEGDLKGGEAQPAAAKVAAQQGGQSLPQEAQQVVQSLGQAIQQANVGGQRQQQQQR